MRRSESPLQRIGIQILLLLLGLMVLSWPMVAQSDPWSLRQQYSFLFFGWLGGICVLYLMGNSRGKRKPPNDSSSGRNPD